MEKANRRRKTEQWLSVILAGQNVRLCFQGLGEEGLVQDDGRVMHPAGVVT